MEKMMFPVTPTVDGSRIGTISPMPPSGAFSNNVPEQMDQVAVENAKKTFLQSWSEYIETIKKSTEIYERQMHLAKYEDMLADHCKKALSAMESDPASLPVPSKVEYRHLPSLIENAKSYTTNPKYAEWQVSSCFFGMGLSIIRIFFQSKPGSCTHIACVCLCSRVSLMPCRTWRSPWPSSEIWKSLLLKRISSTPCVSL